MFRNTMPRYEVLSQDAMAMLDKGWRKLMTEIGVEFMDERALELFRKAGQRVEGHTVFLDPDFVLTTDTLVTGDDCFFVATGITDGDLMRGVRYYAGGCTTESLVMRSRSGTIRKISSEHQLSKLRAFASIDFDS